MFKLKGAGVTTIAFTPNGDATIAAKSQILAKERESFVVIKLILNLIRYNPTGVAVKRYFFAAPGRLHK